MDLLGSPLPKHHEHCPLDQDRVYFLSLLQYQHVTSQLLDLRTLLVVSRPWVQCFLKTKLSASFLHTRTTTSSTLVKPQGCPWYQQQKIQWFYCNEFQRSSPCSFNSISTSVSFLPTAVRFFPSVNITGRVTTKSGTMLRCSPPSNYRHRFRFINYFITSKSGTWDDCLLLLSLSHQESHLLLS